MNFLRIRPEQMQAFRDDVTRRFVAAQNARVADLHALAPNDAERIVSEAMARAKTLGIDEESDVVRFIDWYAERGRGFDLAAPYAQVKAVLEDASLPGWARMRLAAEALSQHRGG